MPLEDGSADGTPPEAAAGGKGVEEASAAGVEPAAADAGPAARLEELEAV